MTIYLIGVLVSFIIWGVGAYQSSSQRKEFTIGELLLLLVLGSMSWFSVLAALSFIAFTYSPEVLDYNLIKRKENKED